MSNQLLAWHGYWVAAPTPFSQEGELDPTLLEDLVRLYISHGVHGILINGSTGEWWAQSEEERQQVVKIAVDAAEGAVPIVAGISHMTPGGALDLADAAAEAGASGVLATVPPYVHPTESESMAWYQLIAAKSALPVMVYNWPRGVGVDLSVSLLDELADMDNVGAIKDSSGDELKTLQTLEAVAGRVRFFARFVSHRGLAILQGLGGDGNIDGGGLGAVFAAGFYEAVWRGDLEAARDLSTKYLTMSGALVDADYAGKFGSPVAQLKAVMRHLGQPGGYVRPPLLDIDPTLAVQAFQAAAGKTGLLDEIDRVARAGRSSSQHVVRG